MDIITAPENPDENKKKVILTPEQQLVILEMLNENPEKPPMVKDVLFKLFNRKIDAREMEGIAVREFIAEKGLKYRGAREYISEKNIILTEEQKEFITNNVGSMKPLELARILFKNEQLSNLDAETREIYKYIKTLPSMVVGQRDKEINVDDYRPPKTDDQAIARINKYVNNASLEKTKLSENQKKDIKNLIGYLHSTRFLSQIGTYSLSDDRELFESEFVRCAFNKTLTEEEADQYIIYATEVVIAKQISKRIEQFENQQDDSLEETGKMSMTLVEAVSSLRGEFNQCITRQRGLLKALQGERNQRIKNEQTNKYSFSDMVVYYQKEENFQHLMKLKEMRDKLLLDEINRLKSMSAMKAEVFGLSERELLD